MNKKIAGATLDAGTLTWVDGYRRHLQKRMPKEEFILVLAEKPVSSRVPFILEISFDEARHAWGLIDDPREQMTEEWFFGYL